MKPFNPVEIIMTESAPDATPEADLFDELLSTGTVRRETVDIYFDQAVREELDAIAAEFDDLPDGPETINQTSRLRDIEERWSAAHERYEASRVTFTLTPIDVDTSREIQKLFPMPAEIENPLAARWPTGQNGPDRERIRVQREEASARYQERIVEWRAEVEEVEVKRVLAFLAASIEKVSSVKGESSGMTVDQLSKIRAAKYGVERINHLWLAFNKVSHSKGEVDRPLSLGGSGSAPA